MLVAWLAAVALCWRLYCWLLGGVGVAEVVLVAGLPVGLCSHAVEEYSDLYKSG